MKNSKSLLFLLVFITSACVSSPTDVPPTETNTPSPTFTNTPKPTSTPTLAPTITPTPIPYNRFVVPFSCDDYDKVFIGSYFDLDLREGEVRNYLGETTPYTYHAPGTDDAHKGIDYHPLPGVDPSTIVIRAAADGVVIFSGYVENTGSGYKNEGKIAIDHDPFVNRNGYVSTYNHIIPMVDVGQQVKQGDQIAVLDLNEHRLVLHFDVWDKSGPTFDPPTKQWGVQVDLYRDLSNKESVSLWTIDNDPQCLP